MENVIGAIAALITRANRLVNMWSMRVTAYLTPVPPLPDWTPRIVWHPVAPGAPRVMVAFYRSAYWRSFVWHVEAYVSPPHSAGLGHYRVSTIPTHPLVSAFDPTIITPDALLDHADYVIVLPYRAHRARDTRDDPTGCLDCVALAKRAAGIYAPDIHTPRQLLHYLVTHRGHYGTHRQGYR